ncbi:MAG TPA: ATP-binding protein [Kineosporiaceae bacterium]|nr:ATP-binding protein [Kineosporiaceae bacterium]
MEPQSRARHVMPWLLESLTDTRVVVVQGARQVGKTTLVTQVVERLGGRLVTLDDDLTREAAQADPAGFLRQNPDGLLAIDEVQRAPALVLALKAAVDRDPRPGRFLLTGSANLLRLPTMQDSLAGRAENVDLYGFSQGEIAGVRERFVERLLAGETFLGHHSDLTRADYLVRACAGGYPEALTRPAGRRRSAWFDNYVRRIVERDAPDISGLHRLGELPLLLRLLAARNAGELNVAGLASDAGIPVRTLDPYLELLETLFLVHRLPAWSTNLSRRTVSRPKVALHDTGLAARLINVSASGTAVTANAQAAGHLLEGFVAGELRRQLTWSDQDARLFHYRDRQGAEVDLLLETDDGRVAGIEVKATSTVTARDTKWLAQLRDRLGDRFVAGVVLHTGTTSAPFGPRLTAAPIDALWTP